MGKREGRRSLGLDNYIKSGRLTGIRLSLDKETWPTPITFSKFYVYLLYSQYVKTKVLIHTLLIKYKIQVCHAFSPLTWIQEVSLHFGLCG